MLFYPLLKEICINIADSSNSCVLQLQVFSNMGLALGTDTNHCNIYPVVCAFPSRTVRIIGADPIAADPAAAFFTNLRLLI